FAMIFYLPIYQQLALGSNPAESGLLLLPLTAGIVVGAMLTGRIIVWTGRPTIIPSVGLVVAALALAGLASLPPARPLLIGLEFVTGLGLGSVMSVMQIVTQLAAGPSRLGAAASTVSLARTLGSSLGASAFAALIFNVIGGAPLHPGVHEAADPRIAHAFRFAFMGAALLCVLAAWTASRVPALRFDAEHPGTPPSVD
ncbi:MAG TPA: MFS transporter, partial [Caldimonas sp.]|nr:MFS transporter [Caldimonas sp.]